MASGTDNNAVIDGIFKLKNSYDDSLLVDLDKIVLKYKICDVASFSKIVTYMISDDYAEVILRRMIYDNFCNYIYQLK